MARRKQTDEKQLPLFEGFRPNINAAKLTGAIGIPDPTAFHIGDVVYFLVRSECVGVNHERKKGGVARIHKFTTLGARRVDHEGEVREALVAEAEAWLLAQDQVIADDDDDTDDNGDDNIVSTDDE